METKTLRYDILLVMLKKVFLVRFEQINDQISTWEKILESLLSDFKHFSSYLSDSQVDKIKKRSSLFVELTMKLHIN